jgi:hypothetical protein
VGCGYPGAALEFRLRYFFNAPKKTTKMNYTGDVFTLIIVSVISVVIFGFILKWVMGISKIIDGQKDIISGLKIQIELLKNILNKPDDTVNKD